MEIFSVLVFFRSSLEFFKRFSETQSFNRFIEERSFVSDKNTYNAFFDECIAKISQNGTYFAVLVCINACHVSFVKSSG